MGGASTGEAVQVVAGVLSDSRNRILVQRRPDHAHLGGTWEFPGGKADEGESREAALARELREELGIRVQLARPLIQVRHTYPEKTVLLDVWWVERYQGTPEPLEGQPLNWVIPSDLPRLTMPPADRPIVHAVQLPDTCLITSDEPADDDEFLERLEARVAAGIRLVQLRTARGKLRFERLVRRSVGICERHGARLVLNAGPADAQAWGAHGVHLNSRRLREYLERPVSRDVWLSTVCHDQVELKLAERLDADFILASPVHPTSSHPGASMLGLDGFAALCAEATMPVYALGGMGPDDRNAIWHAGGQGVAGISHFW